jgi:hypothetical protein
MNRMRAVAGFFISEILFPAVIVWLCVLAAARFLPLVSSRAPSNDVKPVAQAVMPGYGSIASSHGLQLEHKAER